MSKYLNTTNCSHTDFFFFFDAKSTLTVFISTTGIRNINNLYIIQGEQMLRQLAFECKTEEKNNVSVMSPKYTSITQSILC